VPLVAGLVHNLRDKGVNAEETPEGPPVDVDMPEEGGDRPIADQRGNIIKIEHADGTITVSLDGSPLAKLNDNPNPAGWFDNLCDHIDEMQLAIIANDLIRDVEEDIESRQQWMDQHAEAIKMLGWKLEIPNQTSDAADGSVDGTSTIRHPMLQEAVLRFWANADAEFLPTDGPVKVRDDDNNGDAPRDQLAQAMQTDFNHFLTKVAKEFYPDTRRMLIKLGFGGAGFKKIYYCSQRNRPVSETVDYEDIIVNNTAISLETAKRITHRIMMSPNTVRRMQILDIYRDIPLSTPNEASTDALKQEKADQQGVRISTMRPEDRDREIYEIYCERDIKGFEHKWKGKPSGLEVPYRITVDLSSRQILEVRRNYDKGTQQLPIAKIPFVMFQFVPGFGFWPIGLLHIMANMDNAATAAWRLMLDNGMFANFPGFLLAQAGARQETMVVRVPPGGGAQVNTNGMDIRQAVMPLPYKTEGQAALMTLTQDIVQQAQRVGMTAELPVSEGREDIPATTILALIEQAQKQLIAVHKGMHTSQAEEIEKIAQVFRDHPESFWQCNRKPAHPWDQETFVRALDDCNLVPRTDPNTASQLHRMIKAAALKFLASSSPQLYDSLAVDTVALESIGYTNPTRFFVPPEAMGKPTPDQMQQQRENDIKQALAQAKTIEAQAKAQQIQQSAGQAQAKMQQDGQFKQTDLQIKAAKTQGELGIANRKVDQEDEKNLIAERVQLVDLAQNLAVHPESAGLVSPLVEPAFRDVERRQQEHETKKKAGLVPPPDVNG
jgi:hypothetical protein